MVRLRSSFGGSRTSTSPPGQSWMGSAVCAQPGGNPFGRASPSGERSLTCGWPGLHWDGVGCMVGWVGASCSAWSGSYGTVGVRR
eukprot:700386-Prorocentrum_lima.AAC.1